jgi:cellulose biosynthesis protein BcsQ
MKSISIFNNKGGVGKTTLTYHAAYALAELGHKTLLIDLDPQSNLTLFGLSEEQLHDVWLAEDDFIDDFDRARRDLSASELTKLVRETRSIHFLLKATEDGTGEIEDFSRPFSIHPNLDLIPGRLTLHMFEDKLSSRWSQAFLGDPLALRHITRIRRLCIDYAEHFGYEFILIDTSPSLGILNKVIISTTDGFVVPCAPDMFSLYGIRNIGQSLRRWKADFDTMYSLLSDSKRQYFPREFVQFLGFTIFNAKKYSGSSNEWNLAKAQYNYAKQIPETISRFIPSTVIEHLRPDQLSSPVGLTAVMHSHATLPNMAQKYKRPIWKVPTCGNLEAADQGTIAGNRFRYEATKAAYTEFVSDLLKRVEALGE